MPQFDLAVVEEIKTLDTSRCEAALRQGDLVQELVPIGQHGGAPTGSGEALEVLAAQTGIAPKTLFNRRHVASRIPETLRRVSVTWSAYAEIADLADEAKRREVLAYINEATSPAPSKRWTVDAVRVVIGREARDHDPLERAVRTAPLEKKASLYERLGQDPEVTDAVARRIMTREATGVPEGEGTEDHPAIGQEARIKAKLAADPSAQYLKMSAYLQGVVNHFDPVETAQAMASSPLTGSLDLTMAQAEAAITWLQRFVQALRQPGGARLRVVEGAR